MQKIFFGVMLIVAAFTSCTKDRIFNVISNDTPISYDTTKAFIVANEFVATGSTLMNEYGKATDWIELYNPSNHVMDFSNESIYITDTIGLKDKYKLSNFKIQPHQFLVVFCDDSARATTTQIHTNFGLSKSGEFVGVYKKNSNGTFTPFTEHPFGAQTSGKSEGQQPDGSNSWKSLTPTPGASNN
jgi:hypothetical protein